MDFPTPCYLGKVVGGKQVPMGVRVQALRDVSCLTSPALSFKFCLR